MGRDPFLPVVAQNLRRSSHPTWPLSFLGMFSQLLQVNASTELQTALSKMLWRVSCLHPKEVGQERRLCPSDQWACCLVSASPTPPRQHSNLYPRLGWFPAALEHLFCSFTNLLEAIKGMHITNGLPNWLKIQNLNRNCYFQNEHTHWYINPVTGNRIKILQSWNWSKSAV